MKSLLSTFGTVKDATNKRYNLFFKLAYDGKQDGHNNVKVEISKRSSSSQYAKHTYLGIPLLVMIKKDMVANKLLAMLNRLGRANRDIFDVWFFLKNKWPINKAIVEERSGVSYTAFLEKSIKALKKMNRRHILDGLGELLNDTQKVWVKNNLVDETIFYLRLELENTQA